MVKQRKSQTEMRESRIIENAGILFSPLANDCSIPVLIGFHCFAEYSVNVMVWNIVRADPDDDGKLFYRCAFAVALKEAGILPDISAGEPVVADTECAKFAAV